MLFYLFDTTIIFGRCSLFVYWCLLIFRLGVGVLRRLRVHTRAPTFFLENPIREQQVLEDFRTTHEILDSNRRFVCNEFNLSERFYFIVFFTNNLHEIHRDRTRLQRRFFSKHIKIGFFPRLILILQSLQIVTISDSFVIMKRFKNNYLLCLGYWAKKNQLF